MSICFAVFSLPLRSWGDLTIHWVDPSGYATGTEISTAWSPAVTLSTLGAVLPNVYAVDSPIGNSIVFGYDNGSGPTTGWGQLSGGALRAQFAEAPSSVSIYYGAYGFFGTITLAAFDAGLNPLGQDTFFGSMDGTGSLTVSYANMAYVQAAFAGSGDGTDFTKLSYAQVPEPSTLALVALGALALLGAGRVGLRAHRRS